MEEVVKLCGMGGVTQVRNLNFEIVTYLPQRDHDNYKETVISWKCLLPSTGWVTS